MRKIYHYAFCVRTSIFEVLSTWTGLQAYNGDGEAVAILAWANVHLALHHMKNIHWAECSSAITTNCGETCDIFILIFVYLPMSMKLF